MKHSMQEGGKGGTRYNDYNIQASVALTVGPSSTYRQVLQQRGKPVDTQGARRGFIRLGAAANCWLSGQAGVDKFEIDRRANLNSSRPCSRIFLQLSFIAPCPASLARSVGCSNRRDEDESHKDVATMDRRLEGLCSPDSLSESLLTLVCLCVCPSPTFLSTHSLSLSIRSF